MIKFKKILIIILFTICALNKSVAEIKDGILISVGNKVITKSDVLNEIKVILILNNRSYSDDQREELQQMAIKSTIERTIKEIEVNKNEFLTYSQKDLNLELDRLARRINMDVETLQNISKSNGLDFEMIKKQIKIELLWNSLIFNIYKNRISINANEIEEQLKTKKSRKEFNKYLLSEIVIQPVETGQVASRVNEIIEKIKLEGFENVAISDSISQTSVSGGDLGWLNDSEISSNVLSKIAITTVGNISEPLILNEGILFFKVRDKKTIVNEISLEVLKNQVVAAEKSKILNMYSMSHYANLKRAILIKFFDE